MKTRLGTAMYMAPEIHDKTVKYQGADADCFAFGVSLFVAKIIGYPWKVPDLIKDNDYKLLAGDYGINSEEFWRSENFSHVTLSEEFKNFIENLLACLPSSRPTMADILGHEWMRQDVLTKEQFETQCKGYMDAAMEEKMKINDEFGVDYEVEGAQAVATRRAVGDEEFKNANFVTRAFRPPHQYTSMGNVKQFGI